MDALDPKDLQPQTMLGMKLIQQPFSKIPDAENLFDFDALKQTRDTISHHLQFSHLLMVVQGHGGSGKNSLANSLIVSDHPALYFFNATAEAGDNLQNTLAKAAQNNHADNIDVLEKRIQDIMYRGQQPVLIINDAEQLSENELQDLIKYTQQTTDENQQTQLKLLLLGTPDLEKNLERNGIINHNQFYLIALPQLNVSNTRSFLMHRLTQAGFRDGIPFSDKDITNIFNMANGNPVATMEYAAEYLNKNKSLQQETFSEDSKVTKPLLLIGASLFVAAILYNSVFTTSDPNDISNSETVTEPLSLEKKAVEQLFNANPNTADNTMDVKHRKPGEVMPKLAPNYSVPSYINQTEMPTSQDLSTITPSFPETAIQVPNVTEVKALEPIQKTTTTPKTNTLSTAEKTESNKTIKTTVVKKAQIKPPKDKIDGVTQSFINAKAKTSQWLLAQPSSNWSLQILAGHNAETLLSYMHQHKLGDKVAYFRKRLGKKDWHVILYGQYKSKEQAKSVIPYLPKHIQHNNPWPKELKAVKNDINQYKK